VTIENITRDFRTKVCESVRIESEGVDRFRVFTPFMLQDGDHLAVLLRRENGRWVLTDEGHTLMHLTYDLDEEDLRHGTRAKLIDTALSAFSVEDRDGELVLPVPEERYGDALYSFVQALLRITDVTYLSRERVRSTFLQDFRAFITEHVPTPHRTFDWHDPVHDPEAKYPVDCRINGMPRPLFVFALPSDDKTQYATIALLKFERWQVPFRAIGVFEDQEEINRKVLARFTDVCDKQFSSLLGTRERITRYLEDNLRTDE
jgi:hypothetical protein